MIFSLTSLWHTRSHSAAIVAPKSDSSYSQEEQARVGKGAEPLELADISLEKIEKSFFNK